MKQIIEILRACTLTSSHCWYDTEADSLTAILVGIAMINDLPSSVVIFRCF